MLGLLKPKNPHKENAKAAYKQALLRVRESVFYTDMGVPDNFDGRFDLLLLHVFALVHVVLENHSEDKQGQDFNQALFDVFFADMDQTLREMGIGDMGMSKHMKRMMKAFNGRMHIYEEAYCAKDANEKLLFNALRQNVYGTVNDDQVNNEYIGKLSCYLLALIGSLKENGRDNIMNGRITLVEAK